MLDLSDKEVIALFVQAAQRVTRSQTLPCMQRPDPAQFSGGLADQVSLCKPRAEWRVRLPLPRNAAVPRIRLGGISC